MSWIEEKGKKEGESAQGSWSDEIDEEERKDGTTRKRKRKVTRKEGKGSEG